MPKETDLANETFWDEPCGESHFKSLGFESLSQFDDWFFDYKYPYLRKVIPFNSFAGKKILEVGLGYGSVSQKIMESGAVFYGLDLAKGPVQLVRERLKEQGASGEVIQGSALDCPWDDSTFRQYFRQKKEGATPRRGKEEERVLYDSNLGKDAAPATEFVGTFGLKAMLRPFFSEIRIVKANVGDELFLRFFPRSWKLKVFGPLLGLDLYANLTK
jgi:hypothetical protein